MKLKNRFSSFRPVNVLRTRRSNHDLVVLILSTTDPDYTNQNSSFLKVFDIMHQYYAIQFLFILGLLRERNRFDPSSRVITSLQPTQHKSPAYSFLFWWQQPVHLNYGLWSLWCKHLRILCEIRRYRITRNRLVIILITALDNRYK